MRSAIASYLLLKALLGLNLTVQQLRPIRFDRVIAGFTEITTGAARAEAWTELAIIYGGNQ